MQKYLSHSEDETRQFAKRLAKQTKSRLFALEGELGAGKTVFVQGFAEGLEVREKITSPSFVLIRHHKIPQSSKVFYHIDLYRLDNIPESVNLEIAEILSNPNNVVVIEWAEKLYDLPEEAVKIEIQKMGPNKRKFIVHSS